MKLGNVIARGRIVELYSLPDNQVLKLFYEWVSAESVKKEYKLNQLVYQAGLPVPQVFNLVNLENRSGIVFENIHGTTMLTLLIRKPWQVAQHRQPDASLWMNLLAAILGKLVHFYYQKRYLELTQTRSRESIQNWLAPLAAVRLLEKVPGEESSLMKFVTKSLRS